ncbi:energy-coupling factor transporter ATPase [Mycoplasmopsis ciconiae]|uniref:Energy-coupling factor transporter ATPase n=1 Tax=Mycoplasmopsis ciconiae TaxID=561067 RepID=A0ABU7MM57_9BACT|nr:energy-coupling factor transporter ATPase [Mycoplasmopsis ciconiae]
MLKINDITFAYKEGIDPALKNVSFEIEDGQYVAILGHNGSGKSTLSKVLVALLKPQKGSLEIDGIVYSKKNLLKIRQKIGIIFQNPDNQFIGASVEDDIAFGLENKNITRSQMRGQIEKYAKEVGMNESLEREPESLSGGQKQRVAIASVLALDPKVMIFDEVTSMLDPKGKNQVLKIIRDLQATRSKTLISITHDMDEAIMADYCLVFSHGKLVAKGKPHEILKDKEIIELAKIDSPFIYKVSEKIEGIEATYDENKLVEELCKLKLKK